MSGVGFLSNLSEHIRKGGGIDFEAQNFICLDWNLYYNLYNPENFEDPENPPSWYKAEDVYQFFEKPFSDSQKILFYSADKILNFETISNFVNNASTIEAAMLLAIDNYTFGGGGAYADKRHYNYAKKTIEIFHNKQFSNTEFLKRNLRLNTIIVGEEADELKLIFDCSWNEEHGLNLFFKNNVITSIE
jgi:hypothetical protein